MKTILLFPLTLVSLLLPILFALPRTPSSPQAAAPFISKLFRQDHVTTKVPDSCPVTKPPAHPFLPPSSYPNQTGPDHFAFGTNKLWTTLGSDGTWHHLPKWPDGSYRQKLLWWSEGYDLQHNNQPPLKLSGERLDSSAPPLTSDEHANLGRTNDQRHPFIVTAINMSTLGCWKITGQLEDAKLTFVVWVTQ